MGNASGRKVHLSLCFNPSHLEYVNPVALGKLRAKGDAAATTATSAAVPADSRRCRVCRRGRGAGIAQSFAVAGYCVGGTLHVIVNNQIGFTTSPADARSSPYATDIAKMLQIPIFHVNGENPEAVAQVVRLAMDFRREFKRDVVIDMYCYRKLGHNETDEPGFTQPRFTVPLPSASRCARRIESNY
jgi:2-oxoglutarate dehydrogenase E1 component